MRYRLLVTMLALAAAAACPARGPETWQGYVEGEFVHVGSGVGGRLTKLLVARGQTVEAATPLYELDSDQEEAAVRQADDAVAAAGAQLADLGTGKRSAEIDVIEAQVEQATATEKQSATQLTRDEAQLAAGGISRTKLDESRAKHDVDAARLKELSGQLEVARLAARPDQIKAQTSEVSAARAALDQAKWKLDQKRVAASQGGLVVDTLFREGEWVPAGAPVVRMLPPANVKIRFFVPERELGSFPIGRKVSVHCDGCGSPIEAAVTYASSVAEFTPPVIYSDDTREKLVFMIEAHPSTADAARLRPGQPVEIGAP
jgi:HlyD family secretion protein